MLRLDVILLLMMLEFYRIQMELLLRFMDEEMDMDNTITACRLLAAEITSILLNRITPVRINNYVERIIPGQTAYQFQEHFRMTPDIFEAVLSHFGCHLVSTNKFSPLTKLMDPRKQFLAVLWLLATPDSYRSVAERFNMGKSSLHRSFINVIRILNAKSAKIIKWPQGHEEATAQKFKKIASIPGVIGAIDGSYIPIKAPADYPERYINRKCFHAITLQAVCNADLMFTDVYAGYPSSVSDHRIFINSDLYLKVTRGNLQIPTGYYIIGDKAYPVLKWCIPPFIERGALSAHERTFNIAIAKTRQCIERSFALLKGRFRRLKYLDMSLTQLIPAVILASCVLHNICLLRGNRDTIERFILEGLPDNQEEDTEYSTAAVENEGDNDGCKEHRTEERKGHYQSKNKNNETEQLSLRETFRKLKRNIDLGCKEHRTEERKGHYQSKNKNNETEQLSLRETFRKLKRNIDLGSL